MFEAFLKELAQALCFSTLEPDKNGACLIIMKEGKIPLLFELDEQLVPNKILVSTPLIDFPVDRHAEIYEMCLKWNGSIEETVSVKPDENMIYLHRRIAPQIQAPELEAVVQSFMDQAHGVKAQVTKLLKQSPQRPQVPPPPSSIQVFPYKA